MANENRSFDKTNEFQAEVAPLLEQAMNKCEALNIPIVIAVTTANRVADNKIVFSTVQNFTGAVSGMSVEQLIAAASLNEDFFEVLRFARGRLLLGLLTAPPQYMQSIQYFSDYRAAIAYHIVNECQHRAEEMLKADFATLQSMMGVFHHMNQQEGTAPPLEDSPEYAAFVNQLFSGGKNGNGNTNTNN